MKKRNKILAIIPLFLLIIFWAITTAQTSDELKNSSFYKKITQLEIPVWNILLGNTLTRYDFTRLLNAIECQDCIVPDSTMVRKYNEESWQLFQQLPWKYFEDIDYLWWTYNWTNYYYCVANIGSDDIMNWYPRGTSTCWWKFCGQRNVTKAEFYQTLSNFLMDRNMFNYAAPWWEIKKWYNKLKTNEPWYKYLNTAQIALIKTKWQETEPITTRLEYTTYLAYCTFNPGTCWFQTFPELSAGNWPIAETNVLIRAWIITTNDVYSLNSAITPADALEKMWITYDRHIRCEFDSDYDCDNIPNHDDNCPYDYNPTQNDFDGDWIWDVCDDDIDWDGTKNPIWFVDDNWTINYWLLKTYPSSDKTPFGEQMEDTAYFIYVNSIGQGSPVNVQFEIVWPEEPKAVEWDFWDLWKWNWKQASHNFNWQGVYTITAKITTKWNRKHILTTQIFLWQTTDNSYNLYIEKATIDKDTATFEAASQWKYDYFERENKATWERKQLRWATKFTTKLAAWTRNNITIKWYANDMIVATATTDVYDNNLKFYTFTPKFAPQLKTINTNITASIALVNISLNTIDNIAWDFWDWTSFMDTKISNKHTYQTEWKKIIVHRLDLANWAHLYATSTLNIQDPNIIWNQTYNINPLFSKKSVKLIFNNKWISIKDWDTINAIINSQQQITLDKPKDNATILELADKQGVVRVNIKLRHWGLTLENNWVITFWLKDQTIINLGNVDALFSWLKCDFDKDWIPDIHDWDIDWDGIPNLIGVVTKEREDCKLVLWENIDQKLYDKHFWICSLDNCPFRVNPDQTDLNVNWIWDICEWIWECWNNIIELWENCKTCKEDVGVCTAFCWNWKQEPAENCKNCPQDMKVCPSLCWNGIIDSWEQCDHWTENNWKDWECTIACRVFDYLKPNCWNGIYDEWEDCISCPVDLGDICIDDWLTTCWDKKIDPGETCINCSIDVWDCTAFCWNWIVEEAENCNNCPKDIWICTSSCGNGKLEPGEQCDSWRYNWYDGKCSKYCRIADINHECWDWIKDEYEQCDKWKNNWKISSRCTKMCTTYNPLKPLCWNGTIDPGENCLTCPVDLWEKCSATCWNWTIEKWEECDNWTNNWYDWKCSFECNDATKNCWNKKVDPGEDCSNCSTDIGSCTSSCGNGTLEPGEQCDNWRYNWYDGKCSKYCKITDTNHKCWDNHKDEYEQCDKWTNNWKPSSLCTLMCTTYDWSKPNCGNWKIDSWEDCSTCPVDLWERCSATCWNWKKEVWEQCDNWTNNGYDWKCSFDCKTTASKCWNNIKETWEDCDDWAANWTKNSKNNCSKRCTTNIPTKSTCWNSVVEWDEECDLWNKKNWKKNYNCTTDCKEKSSCPNNELNEKEKCENCSADLKDICINNWEQSWECWNKIIEPGENCSNCEKDVWKCTGFCWNGIIEDAEDCSSCPKDVWSCTSSCGNWIVEPGEECDSWAWNWWDGKCSEYCRIVDSNHECWDKIKDEYEECDLWKSNWIKGSACTASCTTYNPLLPNCGNWKIDPGENCLTCPVDLWTKCSVSCWNGKTEIWEECDNWIYNWYNGKCSFECTRTTAVCWNNKREWNEKCDDGQYNWTTESPNKCSEKCTKIISTTPECWNWAKEWDEECDLWNKKNWKKNYNCTTDCKEKNTCPNNKKDKKETCETCPIDLWDICITEWEKPWECGNWIIEEWEDCKNCENDVKSCTAFCWNKIIEEAENCSNCTKDVKNCRWSCWNGTKEAGEECDHGRRNWLDGKCSEECKIVDSEHECWDNHKDEDEECDKWKDNWKPSSLCTLMCTTYISSKPLCWNGIIDFWEDCTTCPVDLGGKCNVFCWNGKKEIWEDCDNWIKNWYDWKCSFECKKTNIICWNEIKEKWEDCDDWGANWTPNSKNNCSIRCTTNISWKPVCWNWVKEWNEECDLWKKKNWNKKYNCTSECKEVKPCPNNRYDEGEDCENCQADLKDICIDDWDGKWCWNKIADEEEKCSTCDKDVWKCNAFCWNNKIEAAEDCKNCYRDVWKCTWSCGNGVVEPGEECDNGSNNNGADWLCWIDCKSVNPNQKCWNGGDPEWTEQCDDWDKNWTIESNCTVMCIKKDVLKPLCWNWVIDLGESCNSCPIDLWTKCLHICWDWKINTPREECDSGEKNGKDWKCWFDCKKTTSICWNGIKEKGEECDEGTGNSVWDICTEKCKKVTKPECWNGKKEFWEECDYWNRNWLKTSICWTDCKKIKTCWDDEIQKNETCQSCPEDLKDKCIANNVCWNGIKEENEECDDWRRNGKNKNCDKNCKKIDKCWNKIKDEWETCKTCPLDLGPCTAKCGNWIVENAENCLNCPDDVWECTSSCGNSIIEEGEQCDNWYQNGKDWKCTTTCEIIIDKTKPYCWDWKVNTPLEKCDAWDDNGKSTCSYICTEVFRPATCGNGTIEPTETCMNCPLDLWKKCQTKCGNKKVDTPREECDSWTRNGRDWKCTTECKVQKTTICWNWIPEEWEECDHWTENNWKDKECTKKCTSYNPAHPNCWNWVVDNDENCTNCEVDVGLCIWSCWNGKLEEAEECDHWTENNWKDNLCDKDCRNIDPNKLCWNGYTNEDEWEECDDGERNWINGQCSLNCKKVTRPNCGNGKIENDENCNNCPEDLGIKCLAYCGDKIIGEWEQCDNWEKNGKDKICTTRCMDVKSCWNWIEDEKEDCISCSEDLWEKCIDFWDECPNDKIEINENCLNCEKDTKKCQWSCWNKIVEPGEQCDNWEKNGSDGKCSEDCINVDPDHYCWNKEVETDLNEVCDLWEDNGKILEWDTNLAKSCTIDCKRFDPNNPTCWNGEYDEWEDCETCAKDFPEKCNKAKCWDWIVTKPYEECDPKANNWEWIICKECKIEKPECLNWECDTICNKSIDKDCDWCYDDTDPCPDLAWDPNGEYKCCPILPPGPPDTLCPNWDCPLVNPICNQCPCQYADYSNTLQKDDQVRARLRDKWYMVHYNYSNLVNISNYIN